MSSYAPFTGPYEKALRLKALVDDINFRKEAQAQQRTQWQNDLEQQQRQNAAQDLATRLHLNQLGAMPATPGAENVEGALTNAFGPTTPESTRSLVTAPGGDKYYLPTGEEQATRAGKLKGIASAAETEEYDADPEEEFDLGARYGNRKISVLRSQIPSMINKLYPNLQREQLGPNDQGDYTVIFRDPSTGQEQYRTMVPGAGKGYHPPGGRSGKNGLSSGAMKMLGDATKAIEDAQSGGSAKDYRTDQQRWDAAGAAVRNALQAFPDELEGGKGQGGQGYYVQPKARKPQAAAPQQQAAGTAATGSSLAGKAISRKNIAQAARIKGMSPQAFEQQWTAGGGTVTP